MSENEFLEVSVTPDLSASLPLDHSDLRCTETIDGDCIPDSPELGPRNVVSDPCAALRTLIDINQPVRALPDWTLIRDERVIQNLLKLEDCYLPSTPDYFKYVQTEVTPSMRKIVADWMLQVCQELSCQPEVFVLAMSYMDRFLARCPVTKSRLQLVGSVCLLISSKFKETCPIPGEKIIFYTDYSITPSEIKDWELLVLQELRWELSSVSPLDYLDQITARLGLNPAIDLAELKRRTETILVLAVTEYQFSYLNPSLLACTALLTAFKYLTESTPIPFPLTDNGGGLEEVKNRLLTITRTQLSDVELCTELILQLLPSYLITIESPNPDPETTSYCQSSSSTPTPTSNPISMSTSPESRATTTSSSSASSSPTTSGLVGHFQTMTSSNLKPDLTDSFSILVS